MTHEHNNIFVPIKNHRRTNSPQTNVRKPSVIDHSVRTWK